MMDMTLHKPKRGSKASQMFKRTISKDLHEQWRKQTRTGDPDAIAKALGVSKPTIDKALIYGCVHKQRIVDGITEFFTERLKRESEAAGRLRDASQGKFTENDTHEHGETGDPAADAHATAAAIARAEAEA